MLLIAAFAIYVIVTKKLRITRSTTVTGDNARNFGIALLILLIPFQALIGMLLRAFLPVSARKWPVPQTIYVVLFGAVVLAMAYYFRDASKEPATPTITPGPSAESGEAISSNDQPAK